MAEKQVVNNAIKATIGIKVERFDSDSQIAANLQIASYLTDFTDTPQEFGRNFQEMCFEHTCIRVSVVRFGKTRS